MEQPGKDPKTPDIESGDENKPKPNLQFFRLHNRITRLEKKLNSFDERAQMLENDLTEKHRETTTRVAESNKNIASFKTELVQLKELVERVNKRLSEFANKDSVKSLKKYINLWSPLNYLSREEIIELVDEILDEKYPETESDDSENTN